MLSDSTIWNFELFVLFFLSDFLECISIQLEHGSHLNQSALVLFIELFEERRIAAFDELLEYVGAVGFFLLVFLMFDDDFQGFDD